MPTRRITFFEYRGFVGPGGTQVTSRSELGLSDHQQALLAAASRALVPGKQIFDIDDSEISAKSYVGLIRIPGAQIEILPKLLASPKSNSGEVTDYLLRNLMFMLSYTNALDATDTGASAMANDFGSFIEIYISIFAERLSRYLLRRGTPKQYVEREENLRTVRGKIGFAQHIRYNSFDRSRVYCQFSEFSEDNKVSQALKYTAVSLLQLCERVETQLALNRCIALMDGVCPQYIDPEILDRSVTEKRDLNFKALIHLTKLFLKKFRPEFGGERSSEVFGIVFDMNELFEEFIYQVFRRHAQELEIEVKAQKKRRLVAYERDIGSGWEQASRFDTYTDIHISFNDPELADLIIDTKYKIISDKKPHFGVANPDVYQILAYRQIYSSGAQIPNVALLYPESDLCLHKAFRVSESDSLFFVRTINLGRDLRSSMKILVSDLAQLIRTCRDVA